MPHQQGHGGQHHIGDERDEEEDTGAVGRGSEQEGEGQGVQADVVGSLQGAQRLGREE